MMGGCRSASADNLLDVAMGGVESGTAVATQMWLVDEGSSDADSDAEVLEGDPV